MWGLVPLSLQSHGRGSVALPSRTWVRGCVCVSGPSPLKDPGKRKGGGSVRLPSRNQEGGYRSVSSHRPRGVGSGGSRSVSPHRTGEEEEGVWGEYRSLSPHGPRGGVGVPVSLSPHEPAAPGRGRGPAGGLTGFLMSRSRRRRCSSAALRGMTSGCGSLRGRGGRGAEGAAMLQPPPRPAPPLTSRRATRPACGAAAAAAARHGGGSRPAEAEPHADENTQRIGGSRGETGV